ncbi:MAG TPA: two-component regulator propeller domain-containing protein [Saprospiraceae bacterium]|nr:two-component regulator propeller domain-containing protein [Saprospiraceae bacterium]
MYRKNTCCSLLLLAVACLAAQETPRVIHFTRQDYQAGHQNWMIAQYKNGSLCVANTQGLMLYDAQEWRLFPLPNKSTVHAVAVDAAGRIFCGGYESFGYFYFDDQGGFHFDKLSEKISAAHYDNEDIWKIILCQGKVYFQSFSRVFEYDYQQVRVHYPPTNIMLGECIEEQLILPAINNGIYALVDSARFQVMVEDAVFNQLNYACLAEGNSPQTILIGTKEQGLFLYQQGSASPWNATLNEALKQHQVNRSLRLSNGHYVFGTILNGIYITDSTGRILQHLNQSNVLQNNTVLALHEDQDGNLWVGMDKGIDWIEINSPIRYYYEKGELGTLFSAVRHQGVLYVASNQGVFRQNPLAQNFELIRGSQGQAWFLASLDGQLLCGHNEGTFLIQGDRIEKITDINGGFCVLKHPAKPNFTIVSTYTGLICLAKNGQGKWQFSHKIAGFSRPLKKILFDAQQQLWGMDNNEGLFRLELDSNWSRVSQIHRYGPEQGISDLQIQSLQLVGEKLLIRNHEGYFCLAPGKNRFVSDSDLHEALHLSNSQDLVYYQEEAWFVQYDNRLEYNNGNRQLSIPVLANDSPNTIQKLSDGTFFICHDTGYALFHPDAIPTDDTGPKSSKPQLTELVVNNEKRLYYLEKPLTDPAFKSFENNITFHASPGNYPLKSPLEVRLLPLETQWRPLEASGIREYLNLSSGSYQYMLRIAGDDSSTSTYSFVIYPPWSETWWAKSLYLLGLLILLLLFNHWQHQRLLQKKLKIKNEQLRQLKEQQIAAKNQQLEKDLHQKSKQLADTTFSLIQKGELLAGIKQGLKTLRLEDQEKNSRATRQKLLHLIDMHLSNEEEWRIFEKNFTEVHEDFFKKLLEAHPSLTPGDLKLAAFLKMNLSTKEIAPLLNISLRAVENKRYRLRKKMDLPQDANLVEEMMRF